MRRGVTIKLRRGLALQWTTIDPVLAEGEMGVETDTRKFKFGDGVKRWTELEYAGTTSDLSTEITARISGDNALDTRLDILEAASSGFGGGGNLISAGTQLAGVGSTVLFSNANGVSFGMNNSSVVTASVAAGVPSPVNFSAGTTSSDLGSVVFSNSNGVSFGLSNGTITAQHNALTSQSNQTQSVVQGIIVSNTTYRTGDVSFSNLNGISFGSNGANVVTVSYTVPSTAGLISAVNFSAGITSSNIGSVVFSNSNRVTFGMNGSIITASISELINFSAGTQASDLRSVVFSNSNGVSFGLSNGTITAQHNALTSQSNPAVSNSAGSFTFQTLNFSNANNVTWGTSAGSIVTASVAAAGAAAITQSIGMSTQTAGGGTGGTTGYATGDDILYHFVPGSNITMSQSINGASGTLSIYGPAAGGGATISSYENCLFVSNIAATLNAASISHAVAFLLPQTLSASFLRIPVVMTTGSTTLATLASATASASNQTANTWNAVVYSMGTGLSSKSLMSVASGSGGATFSQRISITNSTQYSISQGVTFPVEGQAANTTRTTQYSASTSNYSFVTTQLTSFSGSRFIDIPFANSLSAGAYWLVFGYSSSSASGGAGLGGMSQCNVRYSNHYGASQANIAFGVMGSTDFTSGGLLGAGSFSTAGGGTTSAFPISAISSSASHPRWYFQMLRSA